MSEANEIHTQQLFCYGTLQVPQVIKAVIGHNSAGTKAVLHEFAIYRVKDAEYPGIVHSPGSTTEGILYQNISDADLKVLDLFEGPNYSRLLHEIHLPDGTTAQAWVYVIAQPHIGILTDETWYLNDFLDNGLEAFMEGYVHGRRDIYSNT